MTVLNRAFSSTTVALDKSMTQIDRLLSNHGVREKRYTHREPLDPKSTGDDGIGRITYEFIQPGEEDDQRLGVRLSVAYQPTMLVKRNYREYEVKGTTAKQAARAIYWMLKAKFDAIDWGLEEFGVAFMPHLVTQLGATFAETPELLNAAIANPSDISRLALPAQTIEDDGVEIEQ